MKEIDIHAHVFNIHFLPPAGAIYGFISANRKKPLSKKLCKKIAAYFISKAEKDEELLDASIPPVELNMEEFCQFVCENNKDTIDQDLEEAKDFIESNFGYETLKHIESDYQDNDGIPAAYGHTHTHNNNEGWMKLSRFLRFIIEGGIGNHFKWFDLLTKKYDTISERLFMEYADIDLFIHHDMDMEDWYEIDKPNYNYDQEQVPRISQLMKKKEGKIIAFYAYNPNKPIHNLKEAIIGIDGDASTSKGYLGVKFYPPNGFRAWYDPKETDYIEEFQLRHLELYQFCKKEHIPIFTHCNYGGMESRKNAYLNSDVKYWAKVLEKFPDLRLCFGHSGGHEGWLDDFASSERMKDMKHYTFSKSFPGQIYQLCIDYPNVYCEFGYTPEVMDKDKKGKFIDRLVQCFNNQAAKYHFGTKIIYGTDWHLLMRDGRFTEYLDVYKDIFDSNEIEDFKEDFFYKNAVKYLNLPDYIKRNKDHFLSATAVLRLERLLKS